MMRPDEESALLLCINTRSRERTLFFHHPRFMVITHHFDLFLSPLFLSVSAKRCGTIRKRLSPVFIARPEKDKRARNWIYYSVDRLVAVRIG